MSKVISILGDSISSFEGYSPRGFEFYDSYTRAEAGIQSVEDTWWMQVIRHKNGRLGYNNSISGSTVSGDIALSATSMTRLQSLAINGTPDVIFLYIGSNDWAYSVLPNEFEDAYQRMLLSLKNLYPQAEIYGATLLRGKDAPDPSMRFFNIDACISPKIYSRIIRKCIEKAGLKLVDLEKYGQEYASIDGIHPNVKGMKQIADLWKCEL